MSSDPNSTVSTGDITALIRRCSDGDSDLRKRLVELLYPELKRIAQVRMRAERPDHTLQPTALVNEFFLELASSQEMNWRTRAHFLAVASRAMHRYLIDYARAHNAAKRPSSRLRLQLESLSLVLPDHTVDALEFDELMDRLESLDKRMSMVVEMRCFGGLTHAEIAQALGIDERTVKRDWQFARAWIIGELRRR